MFAAAICGYIGLLVVAIFGPLIFPLSLSDAERTENFVIGLAFVLAALFGAVGIVLCWKLTARWERKD